MNCTSVILDYTCTALSGLHDGWLCFASPYAEYNMNVESLKQWQEHFQSSSLVLNQLRAPELSSPTSKRFCKNCYEQSQQRLASTICDHVNNDKCPLDERMYKAKMRMVKFLLVQIFFN